MLSCTWKMSVNIDCCIIISDLIPYFTKYRFHFFLLIFEEIALTYTAEVDKLYICKDFSFTTFTFTTSADVECMKCLDVSILLFCTCTIKVVCNCLLKLF